MAQDLIKGEIAFLCDGDGEDACHETLETGERRFLDANEVRDGEGWRAFKKDNGNWGHRCPDCSQSWVRLQREARGGN